MHRDLVTVGHGTAGAAELTGLLRGAGVDRLVDVRRFPGSRAHPHVAREALAEWLPAAGVRYRWEPRLGGRRSLPGDSPDRWWQVPAFRAYAGHMRGQEFLAAMDQLLAELELPGEQPPTEPALLPGGRSAALAVMCSESLWWRCHRRLIADFAVLVRGRCVFHLDQRGRLTAHPTSAGARLTAGGSLVYDRT